MKNRGADGRRLVGGIRRSEHDDWGIRRAGNCRERRIHPDNAGFEDRLGGSWIPIAVLGKGNNSVAKSTILENLCTEVVFGTVAVAEEESRPAGKTIKNPKLRVYRFGIERMSWPCCNDIFTGPENTRR
jgi:hypothetical protein